MVRLYRGLKRSRMVLLVGVCLVAGFYLLFYKRSGSTRIPRSYKKQNPTSLREEDPHNTQHIPTKEEAVLKQHRLESPGHFLVEEPDFCDRHPDLQIIGYIHSNISSVGKRNVTRMTWANKDLLKEHNINMAVVFFVGRPKNQEEERIVQEESQQYGDLVQGNFEDEKFSSDKALIAMVWINLHCSRVPWTLHADDDVLVDPFLLKAKITDIQAAGVVDHFYCRIFNNTRVAREGEWKVAPEDFSKEVYPTYCSSSMWFVPTPVVPRLLEASRTVNYVSDTYLTGMVAEEAGVGHTHERLNLYWKLHGINDDDIDKTLAWADSSLDRENWWWKIVQHQKLKMRKPWKDDRNANPVLPRRFEEIPFGQPPSIPTRFLIEEADFCTKKRNPRLRTIGFVMSTISAVKKRATTRRTWANSDISNKYGFRMAVVFIVGRAKNEREEQILKEESDRYHDMVQGDFEDRYNLLTYKTLAGLVWVHRHCSHVRWTFKADDDILINDFLFVKMIKDIEDLGAEHKFYCSLHPNRPVFREGNLRVLPEEFSEDQYPPYCSGSMWFMLTALAPRLLSSAQVTNILHIEDAYVTGLLARQAGIGHTPHIFAIFWKFYSAFNKEDFGNILVWVLLNEKNREDWPALIQHYLDKNEHKIKKGESKT